MGHGRSFEGDGTVFYLESNDVWLYNHIDTFKLIEFIVRKSELYVNQTSVRRLCPLILSSLESHACNSRLFFCSSSPYNDFLTF